MARGEAWYPGAWNNTAWAWSAQDVAQKTCWYRSSYPEVPARIRARKPVGGSALQSGREQGEPGLQGRSQRLGVPARSGSLLVAEQAISTVSWWAARGVPGQHVHMCSSSALPVCAPSDSPSWVDPRIPPAEQEGKWRTPVQGAPGVRSCWPHRVQASLVPHLPGWLCSAM